TGAFMAIQGLWAVPWMMEVEGLSRAAAADYLLVMNLAIMGGYVAIGALGTTLARRGIHARHLFGMGFAVNLSALALIAARAPASLLWWALYGLGATVNILAFTALNAGFARGLAGRTNTTLNLAMFIGSFVMQWGIGVTVDAVRSAYGVDTASGLRIAFVAV